MITPAEIQGAKLREVVEDVATLPTRQGLPTPADWQRLTIQAKSALRSAPYPQRQDSLDDQLRDLQVVANKLGMYDAADVLSQIVKRLDPKLSKG